MSASWRFEEPKKDAFVKAGIGGVSIAVINWIASKVPAWLALILFLVTLAAFAYLVYWWMEQGSTWKELATFILMALLLSMVSSATVVRIRDICSIRWLIGTMESIPMIVFLMSIGYMIANYIWYRYDSKERG